MPYKSARYGQQRQQYNAHPFGYSNPGPPFEQHPAIYHRITDQYRHGRLARQRKPARLKQEVSGSYDNADNILKKNIITPI